jgi:hypothetical protein
MREEKKISSHKKSKHTRKIKRIRTHHIFYKFINKTIIIYTKADNICHIGPGYYNIFITHVKKK